jgi:hypothetical protein
MDTLRDRLHLLPVWTHAPPRLFLHVAFCNHLTLILQAQHLRNVRLLYWLPLAFLLWANLHIQFVYGIALLGLFVVVNVFQQLAATINIEPSFILPPTLPLNNLLGVFAACVLSSCIGPYSFHLYQVIVEYSKATLPYSTIIELQPLSFTYAPHYLVPLLAAGAFFAVGWQRKLDVFKLALLAIASVVAFRTQRDAWFICIPAAAFIADALSPAAQHATGEEVTHTPETNRSSADVLTERSAVAAGLVLILILIAHNTDFSARGLNRAISREFPVDAANFLRRQPLPGPLYNNFDWGGFLIWYLPQYPVAIDGRNDLYGDELDSIFLKSEGADASYKNDPYLDRSGLVLLKNDVALATALTIDPRFRTVYRDQISVIFVRE